MGQVTMKNLCTDQSVLYSQVMLLLEHIGVDEPRRSLIKDLSVEVPPGEVTLTSAPTALERTALSLIASGRMHPDHGTVQINGSSDARALRRHTALVDAPDITAPEHHMRVRDTVSEALALIPRTPRTANGGGSTQRNWLAERESTDLADVRVEDLPVQARLWLLLELAFTDPRVQCAVLDSPDRHDITPEALRTCLVGALGADQDRAVLAVVKGDQR